MSMELFHRNMAFTLYHADQMPLMTMAEPTVERIAGNLHRVRVDVRNERLIPTITERARRNRVVRPDLVTVSGNGIEVVAAGWVPDVNRPGPTQRIDQNDLNRIIVASGHPGRTTRTIEYVVRGSGPMTIRYSALKGGTVERQVRLP